MLFVAYLLGKPYNTAIAMKLIVMTTIVTHQNSFIATYCLVSSSSDMRAVASVGGLSASLLI